MTGPSLSQAVTAVTVAEALDVNITALAVTPNNNNNTMLTPPLPAYIAVTSLVLCRFFFLSKIKYFFFLFF